MTCVKTSTYFIFMFLTMSAGVVSAQSDSQDSDSTGFKTSSLLGGDIYLTGDYALTKQYYTSTGAGLGAEIRVKPFFGGYVAGVSNINENYLDYWSLYGGINIDEYRFEIGESRAPESQQNGNLNYTHMFLGVSTKLGGFFFFEPELKIIEPISATLIHPVAGEPIRDGYLETNSFGLRYIYFVLSLKFGFGIN